MLKYSDFKIIQENIALAKAILNRHQISSDSPEYSDYLKIRELCGEQHGYVGILTRLRFIDNVTDMDEIASILDLLKGSKIDLGKLNKMSYDDIIDIFYDKLSKSDNKDYELVYKDDTYSYYKVYTHAGILEISSPAWCLKTKSNYDNYQSKYPIQYVVVDNRYKNKLISPKDNYLDNYSSNKGWVRYGISLNIDGNNNVDFISFDDNNKKAIFNPRSYTFYGVMCTVLNLEINIKKSYYDHFRGCEPTQYKGFLKVKDNPTFINRIQLNNTYLDNYSEVYITLSKSYSSYPTILLLNNNHPHAFFTSDKNEDYANISGSVSKKIVEDYAINSESNLYIGIKLKLANITMEDVQKNVQFIKQVDNWLIFHQNDNYYLVVNTDIDSYNLPSSTFNGDNYNVDNPLYFYLNKKTFLPYKLNKLEDFHKKVVDELKEKPKGLFNFFK